MKKYILKSLFVSVLCMLAASCQDTEFVETLDSSKAQVMFSVAMDSPAARSRATWGEDYTPSDLGDEYDNRIDLDQFIVKIEAGGKTYNVTDIIKWKEGETNEYKFVGIVKNQNGENVGKVNLSKAKISVYANMGNDANANFATMTFNQGAENIPMWGALTVENLEFAPGKRTNVDDIYLLRAMAKFQVTLGEDAIEKGYTLTKASLNKFNRTGYNMPTGYAGAESTMALDMEGVLNENTTKPAGVTELTEATEDGKGWVIYLPEISNTTASELKMLLTFSNGNNEKIETEVSVKDYTTANTGLVNIVRNHWYKYVIEDIVNAKPVVKYETLDWETINIHAGGEGYLYLNKHLIEIYNSNVNTDQLTFTSSSKIESIVLKDVYNHKTYTNEFVTYLDETIDEDKDATYAYYINKYGNKIQLGTDPGFEFEGKEESIIKEQNILKGIKAEAIADKSGINGSIKITSPYIGHDEFGDSHYDAIRYLEFEVTNKEGLTAVFRVMQYPPIVIVHEEGYFSYRKDFKPDHFAIVNKNLYPEAEIENDRIVYNGMPAHYHNFYKPTFFASGFWGYHDHEYSEDGKTCLDGQSTKVEGYENSIYGHWNLVWHKTLSDSLVVFHRDYWKGISTRTPDQKNYYYKSVGPLFKRGEKWYRRHYTGNFFEIFWSKAVVNYHNETETIVKVTPHNAYTPYNVTKTKDQVDIIMYYPGENDWIAYLDYPIENMNNHRMYHLKATMNSDNYNLGYPKMKDGITQESESNAHIVSPSLMLASQLGETFMPKNEYHYIVPTVGEMYKLVKDHCKNYVETTYQDIDGDHEWDQGEPIIHYDDWRLPTKAEIDLIIDYQTKSRVMDTVLDGEYYFCSATTDNEENYGETTCLSNRLGEFNPKNTGYHIRCVRDVKTKIQKQ